MKKNIVFRKEEKKKLCVKNGGVLDQAERMIDGENRWSSLSRRDYFQELIACDDLRDVDIGSVESEEVWIVQSAYIADDLRCSSATEQ